VASSILVCVSRRGSIALASRQATVTIAPIRRTNDRSNGDDEIVEKNSHRHEFVDGRSLSLGVDHLPDLVATWVKLTGPLSKSELALCVIEYQDSHKKRLASLAL
jgi:hypothetical protein